MGPLNSAIATSAKLSICRPNLYHFHSGPAITDGQTDCWMAYSKLESDNPSTVLNPHHILSTYMQYKKYSKTALWTTSYHCNN